jgi:uncharacterized membrane protein
MINRLKEYGKYGQSSLLFILSISCFLLSISRFFLSGTKMYLFLNWNLFLSFIPWAVSSFIIINPHLKQKTGIMVLLLLFWLLFFPNAPYILTDLIHISRTQSSSAWFDLVMVLSFSWTGIMFGLLSLNDIEKLLLERLGKFTTYSIVTFLLFLSSFGVYIGRFLRWNSCDIVQNPTELISDISLYILQPMNHKSSLGLMILLGVFLNFIYWSLEVIKKEAA